MLHNYLSKISNTLGIELSFVEKISHQRGVVVSKLSDAQGNFYALKQSKKLEKISDRSYDTAQLFHNETTVLSSYASALGIAFYASGNNSGIERILMNRIEGKNPFSFGRKLGQKNLDQKSIKKKIYTLFLSMAKALERVHNAGLVHGDIQPRNFIYNRKNNNTTLVDFALSSPFGKLPFDYKGALAYFCAPEIASDILEHGKATCTQQSDIFSLGVCFYHILAGRYAFGYPQDATVDQILTTNSASKPREFVDIALFRDEKLEKLVFGCLDRTDRRVSLDRIIKVLL